MKWKKILDRFPAIKDISILTIGHVGSSLIAAGFWFYIALLIGDSGYGQITYFLTIAGVASGISMFGAPNSLIVYSAKGEKILPILSLIIFPASAIASIIVFLFLNNLGASIHVFSYVIFALISAEFLGRRLFKSYMKITIIQKLLMASLAILFYNIIGFDGIIFGIALSFSPFIILYYKEFKNYKLDVKVLNSKKKFILNNYLLDFSRIFAASMDKIIIAPLFGFAILGNYALGIQFYTVSLIFPSIIFQYILPQDAQGNPSTVLKKITIIVSCIITVIGIIFSPIIIKEFFSEFVEAVSIVQIIILGVIPGTVNYVYISKFLANLENKIILLSSSIFLITIIIGIIILGNMFNVYGIAIAFVLANTSESIFLVFMNRFNYFKKFSKS